MVYYLTPLSCACIYIVGTLRTTRRSASAKEQPHCSRGKHGRDDGRRRRQLPGPGHPAPEDVNNSSSPTAEVLQAPDIRRLAKARTSGPSPGNPASTTEDIQKFYPPARTSGPQPGHPAPPEAPDIRPDARTFGSVCLRTVKGRSPCTPSTP